MSTAEQVFVKYTVTISRRDVRNATGRDWKQVADSGNKHDGGIMYDYVTYPTRENVDTEILKQEIRDETLDIKAVIKAIN